MRGYTRDENVRDADAAAAMFGALDALREDGRLGKLPMVSRNGNPKAVQAGREGPPPGTRGPPTPAPSPGAGSTAIRPASNRSPRTCWTMR